MMKRVCRSSTVCWVVSVAAGLLLVLGLSGCETVNRAPIAAFWFAPDAPNAGEDVRFVASESYDPDSDDESEIELYEWTFGDGSDGTGEIVTHTYAAAGSYSVLLRVTDAFAAVGTATATVLVGPAVEKPPVASFTYTPLDPTVGEQVLFSAAASVDPAGVRPKSIVQFEWTFGDGSVGQGESAQHAYAQPGPYVVTLTVTDDDGGHGTAQQTVVVTEATPSGNPAPVARFTFSPASPYQGQEVTFSASQSYDPAHVGPKSIALYAWGFGDGGTAAGKTVTYTYEDDGTFTVSLTVTDDDGGTDTESKPIVVQEVVIPPPPPPPG